MTCILRAIGQDFDPTSFLADSELKGATPFHRGDAMPAAAGEGQRGTVSGFNLPISEVDFDDLEIQIQDALHFLRRHEDELRRLAGFPGVEEVCLDFGLPRPDVAVQTDVFPAELLWQVGALDIDLVVTHYAVAPRPPLTPQ
jgi:hypothetical protein